MRRRRAARSFSRAAAAQEEQAWESAQRRSGRKGQPLKRGGRHKAGEVPLLVCPENAPRELLRESEACSPLTAWIELTQKVCAWELAASRKARKSDRRTRGLPQAVEETWTSLVREEPWGRSTVWRPGVQHAGGRPENCCPICKGLLDGSGARVTAAATPFDPAHSPEGERKHAALLRAAAAAVAPGSPGAGSTAEYEMVMDYVLQTLGRGKRFRFLEVTRLENPHVNSRYLSGRPRPCPTWL
jgi:hypothetical protein